MHSLLQVNGHVSLTFPRARLYDLDFLDNARTPGPCGMPKGWYTIHLIFIFIFISFSLHLFVFISGDVKTTLLSGSNFNVTWHLAYPHKVSDFVLDDII